MQQYVPIDGLSRTVGYGLALDEPDLYDPILYESQVYGCSLFLQQEEDEIVPDDVSSYSDDEYEHYDYSAYLERERVLQLLLVSRELDEGSLSHQDYLPLDLFALILHEL